MSEPICFSFNIDGEDFTSAGKASVQVKKLLRQLDFDADTIRRVSVAMYEATSKSAPNDCLGSILISKPSGNEGVTKIGFTLK